MASSTLVAHQKITNKGIERVSIPLFFIFKTPVLLYIRYASSR
ncbi:hypothetical protein HMPREF1991_01801 [Hoylesella loescheii DSM 19665 = JCM 12249 = ATCC 15930]|uniref:Uncharacterized protein n=1 Tax=Hoylesella loescheii DSM 19665 = JCM 12249 = ATCC 15930 TaxID=1122985 RepID=A0A069QHD2_HOYLO|nr:hypothetical protein HMPREF1991_01801 [Hoylesella loescheii DSM 19665 = JCM 12249 = ATCC 15930]